MFRALKQKLSIYKEKILIGYSLAILSILSVIPAFANATEGIETLQEYLPLIITIVLVGGLIGFISSVFKSRR